MLNSAEEKTNQALHFLKKRWSEIIAFIPAQKNGELDTFHTDFLILLRSKMSLQLQVKSTEESAATHTKKHQFIVALVVQPKDSVEEIAARIKTLILECYQNITASMPT